MGWIGCIHCEKNRRDFVARTFVWIEPVKYVLQQVSCSYETIPNAPKYNKTDRIISLGSNGMDLVRSLRKIPTSFRGTNFCINYTSSPHFAPSFMQLRNDPKCTQTLWNDHKCTQTLWNTQNMSLGSNGVDQVRWLRKITTWHRARTYVLIAPVQYVLQQVSCSYEMIPNAPKYYEMDRNISLSSNGVDWVHSLRKKPSWLHGTNFCMNWTS